MAVKAPELYQRYQRLRADFSQLHRDAEANMERYYGDHWKHEGAPGEGEERITLNTYANTIDRVHAILTSQKRKIHVVPASKGTDAQRKTTEIEKWLQGVFHVNQVRSKQDAVSLAMWNALVRKFGVVRFRWDETLAETTEPAPIVGAPVPNMGAMPMIPPMMGGQPPMGMPPMMGGNPMAGGMGPGAMAEAAQPIPNAQVMECKELPIVIENVAPENVFVKFGGPKGILYLFYAAKRTIEDIEAEIGKMQVKKFKGMAWEDKATIKVDFLEYWGWGEDGKLYTAKMVDDEYIKGGEHQEATGYNDIPYVLFFCYRTPSQQPHLAMRCVVDGMGDTVHVQEKNLTKLQRMLKMFAMMPLVVQSGSRNPPEVDTSLGAVVFLQQGQDMKFPVWPGTPPDFKWIQNVYQDVLDQAGLPIPKGTGSGYENSLIIEDSRTRLGLIRSNAELALTQLCQGIVALGVNFAPDMAIPVWGQWRNEDFYAKLTGSEMKGHIIDVTIASELPGDEVRKATIGGQLKAQGALSDRTIQERYLNIENSDEEAEQILMEQATKHPIARLLAMLRVLAEDKDPIMHMVHGEVMKMLMSMNAPPAQESAPGAPQPGMAPPAPAPQMVPQEVIPAVGQGQVLRQQQGLPPTAMETGVPSGQPF